MLNRLRLDPYFRRALYGLLAALFGTGAAWLWADAMKDSPSGEMWQSLAANLLMLHGGGAMLILMMFGALFPLHIRYGWRAKKNLVSGCIIAILNSLLVVTAFGLYYSGSESLRPWMSDLHIGVGLSLPVVIFAHVLLGRRSGRV